MAIDTPPASAAVSVSLQSLKDGSIPLSTLEEAFGESSLGIILVSGLPEKYVELRARLLSYSSYLANLPAEELALIENARANYNVGWSRGRETLADGRYDTLKGSFYAQPVHNPTLESKARELYSHVPEFTSPNVWPSDAALPGFESVFAEMCELIVDVAGFVARNCDRFGVAMLEGYEDGTLEKIVRGSVATKARLLHYFPPPSSSSEKEKAESPATSSNGNGRADEAAIDDDWCATHRDLGALTGLTSQMFVDEAQHPPTLQQHKQQHILSILPELDSHPDPKAGLWIQDRAGRTVQVDIPRDCLAFQTGVALELLTRGKFKAVPHFVRGGKEGKKGGATIARNTLAVFTQPNLWEKVDDERDFATLGQFELGRTV